MAADGDTRTAIPEGWQADNITPVGYSDLGGRPGAFKIAVTEKDGRWYLYLGHLWHYGWSIVEVTDPARPRYVKFIEGPANTWTIQLQVAGGETENRLTSWGAVTSEISRIIMPEPP